MTKFFLPFTSYKKKKKKKRKSKTEGGYGKRQAIACDVPEQEVKSPESRGGIKQAKEFPSSLRVGNKFETLYLPFGL